MRSWESSDVRSERVLLAPRGGAEHCRQARALVCAAAGGSGPGPAGAFAGELLCDRGGSRGTSACRTGLASARPYRALAVTLGPCSAATGQHRAVTRHSMTPPESWEVGCNVPVTFPT